MAAVKKVFLVEKNILVVFRVKELLNKDKDFIALSYSDRIEDANPIDLVLINYGDFEKELGNFKGDKVIAYCVPFSKEADLQRRGIHILGAMFKPQELLRVVDKVFEKAA